MNIKILHEYKGHKDSVYKLRIHNNELYSSGGDGIVAKWDLSNFDKDGIAIFKTYQTIYDFYFFKNLIIISTRYGAIYVIEEQSNKILREFAFEGEIFSLIVVNTTLFVGTSNGKLYLFDLETLILLHQEQIANKSIREIRQLNTDYLHISTSQGFIAIYSLVDRKVITTLQANQPSVFSSLYLEERGMLISGGRDAQLHFFELNPITLETELIRKINAHWFTINTLETHTSIPFYLTASRDKSFKIWDKSSDELLKVFSLQNFERAHTHSVNTLCIDVERKWILSAGDDKRIIITSYD